MARSAAASSLVLMAPESTDMEVLRELATVVEERVVGAGYKRIVVRVDGDELCVRAVILRLTHRLLQ